MLNLKLPVWLDNEEGQAWAMGQLLQTWWEKVETWLQVPLVQIDPDTCTLGVLDLIAWGRNVERFTGEPESLYRLRVKYALVNAEDAGSAAGIKRVFDRLGIGYVELVERDPDKDWDIITLHLSDAQLSENHELLQLLLTKYGRTCRRYEFESITPVTLGIAGTEFNNTWSTDVASY